MLAVGVLSTSLPHALNLPGQASQTVKPLQILCCPLLPVWIHLIFGGPCQFLHCAGLVLPKAMPVAPKAKRVRSRRMGNRSREQERCLSVTGGLGRACGVGVVRVGGIWDFWG